MITLDRAPQWDKYTRQFFQLGVCISLSLAIIVLNYTSYEKNDIFSLPAISDNDEIETIPIRTIKKKKIQKLKPVLVKPSDNEPIPMEEPDIEYVDKIDENITADTDDVIFDEVESNDAIEKKVVLAPPKAPEPKEEVEEIKPYLIVQNMPTFGDCAEAINEQLRRTCTTDALLEFIYKNLKYPSFARDNGIEGNVVVEFVINAKGEVADQQILRDIGGGCGDAALKTIMKMPDWKPGRQNGKKVSVVYRLPVKFKLY